MEKRVESAAAAVSLGWKIDWEHRYGISRESGTLLPVFDTTPRPTSTSPAPEEVNPQISSPKAEEIAAAPAAQTLEESTHSAESHDEGSETLPTPPSDLDLASLLLRPPLVRSETKSTMAARVEASQRSDVILDPAVPDGRPIPVPPPFMAAQVIPPGSRYGVVDEHKHDLFAAQAKEDGTKHGTVCRHLIEDSLESLDSRECLHVSWSQRYGINSRGASPAPLTCDPPSAGEAAGHPPVGSPSTEPLTMCSHCEDVAATVVCPPCGSVPFCGECDSVLHRAIKLRSHVRRRMKASQVQLQLQQTMASNQRDDAGALQTSPSYFQIDRHEIRILAKLGEGYFGIVYKGLWAGQSVAVKKLKHGTRRHVDEFVNECLILGKLRHPNITTFYGVTASPDWLIVTELLHGSLYKLLHGQTRPVPPSVLRRIAKDVACGAAYIHGLTPSIVHRDINSSNVLLTGDIDVLERIVEEGRNEPLAKLSDFGLSRSVERFMTQCTGNAYYLAPEVFRGQHYTEKADCYSYGILLWELFTRKYPFSNLNPRSAAFQQAELDLRPPITPTLLESDPDVVSIMTRAWEADPEKRMPFRDIVAEWCSIESSQGGGSAAARAAQVEEGEEEVPDGGRWADRQSANGDYLCQPMEWRRRMLDDKLKQRPSVMHVMQRDMFRPQQGAQTSTSQEGEQQAPGAQAQQEAHPATMFGYDYMPKYLEMM